MGLGNGVVERWAARPPTEERGTTMRHLKSPLRRALAVFGLALTALVAGAAFGAAGRDSAAPPLPSGCPTGNGPVNVADVTPPARLTIAQWKSDPAVIGSNPGNVSLTVHVTACNGRPVSGALVFRPRLSIA